MGKEYNVIFLMLNLFKWFCLKANLTVLTSTKASTSAQNMYFYISKCIRTALENSIHIQMYHWPRMIEKFVLPYKKAVAYKK